MTEDDKFNRFLPEDKLDRDNLSIEIPANPPPIHPDRIPSGYEPMGEIQLRGRVFRGLAGGQVAWWVLITGWILFGTFALLMLYVAVASSSLTAWLFLATATIPLFILGKGTLAKAKAKALSRRRRRR